MVWKNNAKFENPKRYDFRLNDFTGGICNTVTETRIKDNQASDLLNVKFEQDGLLKKRNGFSLDKKYSKLLHGEIGELIKTFVVEPSHSNKKGYFLVISNKKLIYVTTNDKVKVLGWNRPSRTANIDGCQFGDKFFIVDGQPEINMYKIKELEDDDLSKKVWLYKITTPPPNFTPKPKPAIQGEWKEIPYPGAEDRAIRRWYEPCQSEMEDGYKGANIAVNFCATMIVTHKDRLYITGNIGYVNTGTAVYSIDPDPNIIYISDILNPEYFPASLPLQTPPTGDKITCLRKFNDSLIIGRKDDVYAISGNTNRPGVDSYSVKKINTHTGMINNRSADNIYNFLFYVGSDGNCYKLTSTSTSETLLATQPVSNNLDFKLEPFSKTLDEIKSSHSGFNPIHGNWHVQVGKDTFLYNYKNKAWTRWSGVDCVQFIFSDNEFYYIRDDGSFYIVDDDIYYDIDKDNPEIRVPIQFYWVSKNIDFGMPSRIKQIRDTYLISELFDNHPSDINIKYEADYVAVEKEHNISSEVARWNFARWDVHRFVYKNIIRSLPIVVGRRCRNFKVFIGNGNQYKGVVDSLPEPQMSDEGQLFYLKNEQLPNLFDSKIELGGIEGTNGTEFFTNKYFRSIGSTTVSQNTRYELTLICKDTNIVCSVLMYNSSDEYLGVKYCSYEDGYSFETLPNTSKIKLSCGDESLNSISLNTVSSIQIREYLEIGSGLLPNGFYVRTKRNPETREYYKKMYDKDLYQPVKVHEVNGIYELRGYR